jgi:hypothetical protein
MKMSHDECKFLHEAATEAAILACKEEEDNNPNDWFPCGFAWVKISPATQPFGRFLKKEGIVDRAAWDGGYDVWNPAGSSTQRMLSKSAGARAYAAILEAHGLKCYSASRMD